MFGKKRKENCPKEEKSCSNCSNTKSANAKGVKACSNCTTEKSSAAPHPTKSCESKTTKSCSNCGGKSTKNSK